LGAEAHWSERRLWKQWIQKEECICENKIFNEENVMEGGEQG